MHRFADGGARVVTGPPSSRDPLRREPGEDVAREGGDRRRLVGTREVHDDLLEAQVRSSMASNVEFLALYSRNSTFA
jgi:hypothetical protein